MGFLDTLKGIFSGGGGGGGSRSTSDGFFFYLRCPSSHPIHVWVNRGHDLARDYDGAGGFTLTKHIVCPTCYKKSIAQLNFDDRYRETSREIENGQYIDEAEYDAAQPKGTADYKRTQSARATRWPS